MYPTLPIGNNANFKAFPFACRIAPQTLMQVVLDVIEALEQDGIRKIVLFNGHGGNTDALRATLRQHSHRRGPGQGAFVCITSYSIPPGIIEHPSPRGGEMEVSTIMHLREDLVRSDKLGVCPMGELAVDALNRPEVYSVRPWHLHLPASACGDVTKSTAEKGRQILEHTAARLAELLTQLSQAPWNAEFPYKSAGSGL
jgi:creatinine amidohydrolase